MRLSSTPEKPGSIFILAVAAAFFLLTISGHAAWQIEYVDDSMNFKGSSMKQDSHGWLHVARGPYGRRLRRTGQGNSLRSPGLE